MRKLLNTLFVTTENAYLSLENENVVVTVEKQTAGKFPLILLEGILCFSYPGASPALMGACAERGIGLTFMSPNGRFLARTIGESHGNVLLRKQQYRYSDDPALSCRIARSMIFGKVYNSRWVLERALRDHSFRIDEKRFRAISGEHASALPLLLETEDLENLRGMEGKCASAYFSIFDDMILAQKETFSFENRNRRPPEDPVNAALSFAYTLLTNDCAHALEAVGLDAYVGFLHRDRPGRKSLALDLMEELRSIFADRFVLTQINTRVLRKEHFQKREGGGVFLSKEGRKVFLNAWQLRKQEELTHPYLKEKIKWGLVPYVQSLLLARFIRGDLDAYPPFLWK